MPLSPRDIRAKTFKKTLRGYSSSEVDFFLDQIAKSIEELRHDNDRLTTELQKLNQKINNYENQSSAVKETLELAREKGEHIYLQAQEEAQKLIENAEHQAESILANYKEDFNRKKQILYEFKEVSDAYKRKFHRLVEQKIKLMDDFEASFESRRAIGYVSDFDKESRIENPVSEKKWSHSCRNLKTRNLL